MLAGVAPRDLDLVPGHRQNIRGHAGKVEDRMRPEIADTGLHIQLAVRADGHDRVPSDRSRPVRTDGDADAAHFRSLPLTAAGFACFPVEDLGALVERFLDERAGHMRALAVRTGRAVDRLAFRRVDPANRDLI